MGISFQYDVTCSTCILNWADIVSQGSKNWLLEGKKYKMLNGLWSSKAGVPNFWDLMTDALRLQLA